MKCCHGFLPLILLLVLGFAASPQTMPAAERPAAASSNVARAGQLAADVRDFATAPGLSRAKREKRIATAVRTAVVAATAYRSDSAEVLGAATELAAAATRAAPAYAEIIAKAAALAPGVSRIDGAAGSIRAAAAAGSKGGKSPQYATGKRRAATTATAHPRRKQPVEAMEPESESREAAEPFSAVANNDQGTAAPFMDDETPVSEPARRRGRNPVEDPAFAVSATLEVSARHDSNVYLASTNEVSDTIISAKPGVALRWGQKSQAHGSLGYAESFEHYQDGTSPNVTLGTGAFDFAYEGAASSASVNANYQQLYQSNSDLQASGVSALVRTDVSSASANLAANPWAKIGGRLGVNYAGTNYRTGGLIGNSQVGVPVDVVFNATPKTDLSVGYVFSTQRPDGEGDSSKDHYFNVGARGQFTAKLGGSLNVGYQTRRVGENPSEHMLAFNGSIDYELTPLTKMTLGANRNFNASALGASTKNTSFQLGLTSDLSPQWRLSATAAYSDNEYGAGVFRADQVVPQERTDHLWEGTFTATYLFTEWFSTSASYLLRHNQSTLPTVEFSDNVLSLTLGLKY